MFGVMFISMGFLFILQITFLFLKFAAYQFNLIIMFLVRICFKTFQNIYLKSECYTLILKSHFQTSIRIKLFLIISSKICICVQFNFKNLIILFGKLERVHFKLTKIFYFSYIILCEIQQWILIGNDKGLFFVVSN